MDINHFNLKLIQLKLKDLLTEYTSVAAAVMSYQQLFSSLPLSLNLLAMTYALTCQLTKPYRLPFYATSDVVFCFTMRKKTMKVNELLTSNKYQFNGLTFEDSERYHILHFAVI